MAGGRSRTRSPDEGERPAASLWNPNRRVAIFRVQVTAQGLDPWVAILGPVAVDAAAGPGGLWVVRGPGFEPGSERACIDCPTVRRPPTFHGRRRPVPVPVAAGYGNGPFSSSRQGDSKIAIAGRGLTHRKKAIDNGPMDVPHLSLALGSRPRSGVVPGAAGQTSCNCSRRSRISSGSTAQRMEKALVRHSE
jgi:hypothetical protein